MTLRGFSSFHRERGLFKWIYKVVHKLEQTQHLYHYKTVSIGEMMRDLYIVRRELSREQHASTL